MTCDARHKLDEPIAKLQARLDAEDNPIEQDKLYDILSVLLDMRRDDLQAMDPKARRMDVWLQRQEDDTTDLY